jgi:zinc protease
MRKKSFKLTVALLFTAAFVNAQKVQYKEFDLDNGLHVILHQDKTAPVVAVSVMYHVGSKNEDSARTGFAHFFEHLLFEGTDNIKRGTFMKIVSSNGGQNNANTTQDRTFYYEVFPSNQLELGLWLESERMLHPVINEVGVKTQNEVVKEEKRQRLDNQPYGKFAYEIFRRLFTEHPYRWQTIGSMEHLDAAKLDEFKSFFQKYYVPNNAVLSIAGDIDVEKATALAKQYFNAVPRGADIQQPHIQEPPLAHEIVDSVYDANIQIPAIMAAYRTPGMSTHDSKVLSLISSVLSSGASSKLYKKMVDDKKDALEVGALNYALEDYGAYITYALPNNNAPLTQLLQDIDEEVASLQTNLISESDYQKIMNQFENGYVSANSRVIGVAENLAEGYTFYNKNTNQINEELDQVHKITREEIRDVAKKYLNKDQRVVLYYLPAKQ